LFLRLGASLAPEALQDYWSFDLQVAVECLGWLPVRMKTLNENPLHPDVSRHLQSLAFYLGN